MTAYVGAGCDPDRFWRITPRLFALEMRGAEARQQRERELVWYSAMLPMLKSRPSLQDFVRPKLRMAAQSEEVLQGMCDALAAAWGAEWVKD
ncbi:hypothetical protein LCM17_12925 [Cereibacter sphaeroides]|nr:hypothetical protein [Cereibacter sphaeroides]